MRNALIKLFQEVGRDYQERGVAKLELYQNNDVQAFYRLSEDPNKVVHVQGYVGLSSDNEARVWARMMDYKKMMNLRKDEKVSVGNEHEATIRQFPNFDKGVRIPYNAKDLETMLEENVPELIKR